MTGRITQRMLGATLAVSLLALPLVASAVSFENLGGTLGLGSKDLKGTVITFIQWILGLLALIAVIMILYGGFVWLTAGGNEEKVATAKKVISAAVIGLVVVLISWAIAIFAVNVISNTTTVS